VNKCHTGLISRKAGAVPEHAIYAEGYLAVSVRYGNLCTVNLDISAHSEPIKWGLESPLGLPASISICISKFTNKKFDDTCDKVVKICDEIVKKKEEK